jgi:hypothetical protein
VTINKATYRERTTTIEVTIENGGSKPVVVDEYETAGKRFLSETGSKEEERYPAKLLVPQGLDVDNTAVCT